MTRVSARTRSRLGLILLSFIAFISLGLPDGLLGVAWPSMRAAFGRSLDSLGMLMFAATTGYITASFLSGRAMARLGVGGLLALSCAATGSALLGYTLAPGWWVVVALGVLAGLGAGAIDAGLNTYVAANFGEGLMQWLHASFGVGITLGPVIMTAGLGLFDSWRWGYVLVGLAQLSLALAFFLTIAMWQQPAPGSAQAAAEPERLLTDYQTPLGSTLRRPAVWASLLLFFLYTGIELTLGAWAYTLLTESRGVAPAAAGLWAGSYWATFTVGRVLAGLFARRVGLHRLTAGAMLLALAGALLVWWNPLEGVSLLGVALTGFALAPIFPALVSGTSRRVGAQHAANTIGMQIAAAGLGAAAIPALAGVLAQRITLEIIPVYLAGLVLALIALYGLSGRRGLAPVTAEG